MSATLETRGFLQGILKKQTDFTNGAEAPLDSFRKGVVIVDQKSLAVLMRWLSNTTQPVAALSSVIFGFSAEHSLLISEALWAQTDTYLEQIDQTDRLYQDFKDIQVYVQSVVSLLSR